MPYLGIDIGGTNLSVGVVDFDYKILGRGSRRSHVPRPTDEFCDDIAAAALDAVADAGLKMSDIACCGVGCPGVINAPAGTVEYSNNLRMSDIPIAKLISDRLGGIKTYIDNDANCAALGEVLAGGAQGARSALVVTIGTGIGGGIIVNNKIYSGCNGVAGEVGHTMLVKNGLQCTCGRYGCFEAYASAIALKRQTADAMRRHPESVMWQLVGEPEKVSGRTPFEAMRMGDETGRKVVEQYFDYLADGLTDIINILQPEVVCLGGGVSKEGDALIAPLERLIAERRFCRGHVAQPILKCAQLANDAGIIGAAMLFKSADYEI